MLLASSSAAAAAAAASSSGSRAPRNDTGRAMSRFAELTKASAQLIATNAMSYRFVEGSFRTFVAE